MKPLLQEKFTRVERTTQIYSMQPTVFTFETALHCIVCIFSLSHNHHRTPQTDFPSLLTLQPNLFPLLTIQPVLSPLLNEQLDLSPLLTMKPVLSRSIDKVVSSLSFLTM